MLRCSDIFGSATNIASFWVQRGDGEKTNLLLLFDVEQSVGVSVGGAREIVTANGHQTTGVLYRLKASRRCIFGNLDQSDPAGLA
jgi:hypothetical protein